MVKEHIFRDFSNHTRHTFRPTHEYCGVEIFSYEHQYTQTYHLNNTTFNDTVNTKKEYRRYLQCLTSTTNERMFSFSFNYNCKEIGEYRIDMLYENTNPDDYTGRYAINPTKKASADSQEKLEKQITSLNKKLKTANNNVTKQEAIVAKIKNQSAKTKSEKAQKKKKLNNENKKLTSLKNQVKAIQKNITSIESKLMSAHIIEGKDIKFDGEEHILKRKTIFVDFNSLGNQKITLELPSNSYFVGAIVRKIKLFTGDIVDAEYSLWDTQTNLALTECEVTESSETSPSESKFTILYSQTFDSPLSRTGVYMDYMDEVNVYYRVNDELSGEVVRRFGGYISSVSLKDDRTTLDISCADRRIDGEHRFLLDSLIILYGDKSEKDMDYYNPINFNNYGQALKYLCDVFEVTLDSNINKSYLVEGERYSTGLSMKFGKKKDIKKKNITVSNATIEENDKFITLRNNPKGDKKQSIILYDGKQFSKKKPVEITKHLTFHMTYGLGETKTSTQTSSTDIVSNTGAGSQKFSKCGVSADKKYVMGIGKQSAGSRDAKKHNVSTSEYYKTIFNNKCPYCGKSTLRWDSCRKGATCIRGGTKRNFPVSPIETEITCTNCDCDFDSVTGTEKDNKHTHHLTKVSRVLSSKSEQTKLHNGNLSGVAKGGETVSSDSVLKAVANTAKQYTYERGTKGQTYSQMKKTGHGDCHGFSDLIFHELKSYGVKCKIYQYATSNSSTHRIVAYLNANNKWVVFPYKKYNVHPSKLNGHIAGTCIKTNNTGGNISTAKSKSSSSTETTSETYTYGYDKDKPIQGYIKIVYSTGGTWKDKTKNLYLSFTLIADSVSTLSGLSTVWVNNATRQTSVDMKNWFADNETGKKIYLHRISFETPKIKTVTKDDGTTNETTWYTEDKSTHDNSSCKMDLHQIVFDDKQPINPTDLQSCGKTITSMLEEIIKQSDYRVSMEYNKHRCDDMIKFSVDNQKEPVFVATEGDNNNILEWNSINCTPVSDLRNKSICVFKGSDNKYSYVDTADVTSMLNYGEQTTLMTESDVKGSKEAYFLARNSSEYNPNMHYTYTIVVPFAPKLKIGDLVEVIANAKQLNDIKTVKSIKIKYSHKEIPHVRTEIGLDEIEPFLRIRKEQENLRKSAREKTTYFGRTAKPVDEEGLYIWED